MPAGKQPAIVQSKSMREFGCRDLLAVLTTVVVVTKEKGKQ
jgi:hypothetical protein